MTLKLTGLWQHPDFMKLWVGETISLLGSQITAIGLPLTAALTLQATPEQMGILGAAEFLPFLLVGLFAGVWVDRRRRRPILIMSDIGRALLIVTIPVAALLNALRIEQLYIVGFLTGILTVFFDVSYQSYLPSLVGRVDLVEGNSKLEVSRSITQIAGPGVAGVLIQFLTAPLAMILDGLSFLISAVFLWRIQKTEPAPVAATADGKHAPILTDIREGLQVVLHNPMLRSIAACTATSNLFGTIAQAVFILYVTRVLKLDAAALGFIFGIASLGGLLGAVANASLVKRFGVGRVIIAGISVGGLGTLMFPLASGSWIIAVPLIVIGQFVIAFGSTVYNINQISLRQTITPHHLLGRMNASMRFIVWGAIPIGSLIGGALGGVIDLRPTLLVGALGSLLAPLWIYFSPVRGLIEQPAPVAETPTEEETV